MNFLDDKMPMRVWDKVMPEPNSGCWLWLGATNIHGYGVLASLGGANSRRSKHYVHRLMYVGFVGEVPAGLVLDHLCRTPACCNPAHLEAVTQAENVRRGLLGARAHCVRGHAFDDINTYVRKDTGHRACIACGRENLRARRERLRLEQGSAA